MAFKYKSISYNLLQAKIARCKNNNISFKVVPCSNFTFTITIFCDKDSFEKLG